MVQKRRCIIQCCKMNENVLIPGEKQYSFISLQDSPDFNLYYNFLFGKDIISLKIADKAIIDLKINHKNVKIIQEKPFFTDNNFLLHKVEKEISETAGKAKNDKVQIQRKKKTNLTQINQRTLFNRII